MHGAGGSGHGSWCSFPPPLPSNWLGLLCLHLLFVFNFFPLLLYHHFLTQYNVNYCECHKFQNPNTGIREKKDLFAKSNSKTFAVTHFIVSPPGLSHLQSHTRVKIKHKKQFCKVDNLLQAVISNRSTKTKIKNTQEKHISDFSQSGTKKEINIQLPSSHLALIKTYELIKKATTFLYTVFWTVTNLRDS